MLFLVLITTSAFILLSFLHIYWGMGGNQGMTGVLPQLHKSQHTFRPGILGKFGVGFLMGIFAFISIGNLNIFRQYIDLTYFKYATLFIGIIFTTRAIGDFHYIGFFKKAKGTQFAKNDTRYYSPVSLCLGLLCYIIAGIEFYYR